MNDLIALLRNLYSDSDYARENLSFNETLSYIFEKYGEHFDPLIPREPSASSRDGILRSFTRVINGYPLAYEVGKVGFYESDLIVKEGVLIPRRDTELLVDEAIKALPKGATFLDLCTGSGCVGLSVLRSRPDTRAILADISPTALETARENARALRLEGRCEIVFLDVLKTPLSDLPEHDAVLMNPPYLRSDELLFVPPNVTHEPSLALDGGEDGLDFYRHFKGYGRLALFEIGASQADGLLSLFPDGRVVYDLCRNPRVFIIK